MSPQLKYGDKHYAIIKLIDDVKIRVLETKICMHSAQIQRKICEMIRLYLI
jgi:hypothetical protein